MKPSNFLTMEKREWYGRIHYVFTAGEVLQSYFGGDTLNSYAYHKQTLGKYYDKECVIAYHTSPMGKVFAIQGARKVFIFFMNMIGEGGFYNHALGRMEEKEGIKFLSRHGEILDKKIWNAFAMKVAAEEL